MEMIKQKYVEMEDEINENKRLLRISEQRFKSLEMEHQILKQDTEQVHQRVSVLSETVAEVTEQKTRALMEIENEARRRRKVEDEIKRFHVAFVQNVKSKSSFQSDFKSIIDRIKSQQQHHHRHHHHHHPGLENL
ncbi:hypothetical protein M569_16870 [Genlisea aurea]|uniref:Uncharacterized protein n=1 Tax=Genlisea aurea TaxID=192259 RepID=S8C0K0_9LAMI|nr:hypothetical protein M569_16870 [Genlisea aurea]